MINQSESTANFTEVASYKPQSASTNSAQRPRRPAESHPGELGFFPDSPDALRPVLRAIEECRAKAPGDFQRILVILAPPDRARSRLAGRLAKCSNTTLVTTASIRQRHLLERLMRPCFEGGRPVIAIDQAEYLGGEELEALNLLINLTPAVLVLLATAQGCRTWEQRWPLEAGRIRRRTHLVLDLRSIRDTARETIRQ
jgi:hypothetical protein